MTIASNAANASDPAGYGDAALLYRAAGWPAPLPLPARRKKAPPEGWTGRRALYPDETTVARWRVEHAGGNIGLRLPAGVLGLDLDLYKAEGRASYDLLVEECGPLPATWMSTSRTDGSGIRFFAVPDRVRWSERRAGPGIELVHSGHRYTIVWPSVHPDGRTYRWYDPTGLPAARVPAVRGLVALPAVWGRRLSEPNPATPRQLSTHAQVVRIHGSGLAAASLAGAVAEIAGLVPGQRRNDTLNRKAFALGGYIAAGQLEEQDVREQLLRAAHANGHVDRHGIRQTLATIDSGLRAGMTRPRRTA